MFPILLVVLITASPPDPLIGAGQVRHPEAAELSGLVASRRHEGVFWTHPDSGNPPLLFAVQADGTVLNRFSVEALNLDWEDVAADADGHLVIGDIGNNTLLLPTRTLYVIDEPDPRKPLQSPLPLLYSITYRYPQGRAFDAEALVIGNGKAVLITKTAPGQPAEVFSIPLQKPTSRLPVVPKKLGALPDFSEPVTGADLSPNGRVLAVCSLDVVRLYGPGSNGNWKSLRTVRYPGRGIESVAWAGSDLLFAEESGRIWRLPARAIALPSEKP